MEEHKLKNLNLFFDAALIVHINFGGFRINLDKFPAFLKDKTEHIIRDGMLLISLSPEEVGQLICGVKEEGAANNVGVFIFEDLKATIKGTIIDVPTTALVAGRGSESISM